MHSQTHAPMPFPLLAIQLKMNVCAPLSLFHAHHTGFFLNPLLLDFTSVRIVPTSSLLGSVLLCEDSRIPKGTVFGGQAGFFPV